MLDVNALGINDQLRATAGEHAGTRYPIASFRERFEPGRGVERVGVVVYDRDHGERAIESEEFDRFERVERRTANTPERETPPELIEAIYGSTDAALSD
jgi:hypothetical protein